MGVVKNTIGLTVFLSIWVVQILAQNPMLVSLGTLVLADNLTNNSLIPPKPEGGCDTECQGRVWIFFSDVNRTSQWGTISSRGMGELEKQLMCRQLGFNTYRDETIDSGPLDENIPVWLTGVNCHNDSDVNNILQCHYTLCEAGAECSDHQNDLTLYCQDKVYEEYYDGEAYLCPPNSKRPGLQTTMGLMQVYLHGESKSLAVVDPSDIAHHFGRTKMDSFCRQMGFSRAQPDSVYTQSALKGILDFNCSDSSWFDVAELKDCNSDNTLLSTPCFGCCYDYPNSSVGCATCSPGNSLVISCVYDPVNRHPDDDVKGNQNMCEFHKDMKLQVCKATGVTSTTIIIIVEGIVIFLLTVCSVTAFVITCTLCLKKKRSSNSEEREPLVREEEPRKPLYVGAAVKSTNTFI